MNDIRFELFKANGPLDIEEIIEGGKIALTHGLYVKDDEFELVNTLRYNEASHIILAWRGRVPIGICTVVGRVSKCCEASGVEQGSSGLEEYDRRQIQCYVDARYRRKGLGSRLVKEMRKARVDHNFLFWEEGINGSKDFWMQTGLK